MTQDQITSPLVKTKKTVYHLVRFFAVNPLFWVYFRGKVIGVEKVPLTGNLIIVSNHASVYDPPLLSASIPRPVSYMAKQELFKGNFGKLISVLGAYPVNREKFDRTAIRSAMSRIQEGWATGIFLEGTRTPDGRIYEPKLGAAMIAAKTQTSLLPVALLGTEKITKEGKKIPEGVKVTVKIGDLIPPPTSGKKEDLELVTNLCAKAINQLIDE